MATIHDKARKIITFAQLKQLILREQVRDPDWLVASDITRKAKIIQEKKKLHRTFLLVPLSENRSLPKMKPRESVYHIFESMKPVSNAPDVPRLCRDAPQGTSLFPTKKQLEQMSHLPRDCVIELS